MKANELRLGNKLTNFLGEVFDCNAETIRSFESNYFPYGKTLPIPLTEEWLLKFKEWKKEDNLYVIRLDTINNSLRLDYINNDGELCWEFYVHNIRGEKVGCAYIKYVHQLQNLYFALTNEELTYEQQK